MIFEVHQPFRLNRDFPRDLLSNPDADDLFQLYFDMDLNREIFNRIARECYFPANNTILESIEKFEDSDRKFKVSFSLSGIFLEQCELWSPKLTDSFRRLVNTGCIELLCQTYYHSLASLFSEFEFVKQIEMHRKKIKEIFNYEPQVFENTECIYNNFVGRIAEKLGFKAVVTEGTERILGWRNPNYIYRAKGSTLRLLLRNYQLSDDIGFRFASREWEEWPLTADKYACWLASTPGDVIVIFIDYETFGEHFRRESGIFDFLKKLPEEILKWRNLSFSTPSEAIAEYEAVDTLDVAESNTISWADLERDVSAWLGNMLQKSLFNLLREMEPLLRYIGDKRLIEIWRYLQTSDHFYYMSTKGGGSWDVHSTFNPYFSPMEAFMVFSRILSDFQARVYLRLEKPELRHKRALRILPPEKGFTFYYDFSKPTKLTAHSLQEFYSILKMVDAKSIRFHMARRDFERWLIHVVGYRELAAEISRLRRIRNAGLLRQKLLEIVGRKIKEIEGKLDGD